MQKEAFYSLQFEKKEFGSFDFQRESQLFFQDLDKLNLDNPYLPVNSSARALLESFAHQQPDPLLLKAAHFAAICHANQYRKKDHSPYLSHPLGLLPILHDKLHIGNDLDCQLGALLHDTAEDFAENFEKSLQSKFGHICLSPPEKKFLQTKILSLIDNFFGSSVSELVFGVTKITNSSNLDRQQDKQDTHRRVTETAGQNNTGVALIKIADRMYNIETFDALSRERQIEGSDETFRFYVPMAKYLNLVFAARELKNYAFRYLEPVHYQEMNSICEDNKDFLEEKNQHLEEYIGNILIKLNLNSSQILLSTATVYENYKLWIDNLRNGEASIDNISLNQNSSSFSLILEKDNFNFDTLKILIKELGTQFGQTHYIKQQLLKNIATNEFGGCELYFRSTQDEKTNFNLEIITKDAYEANYFGASAFDDKDSFKSVFDSDGLNHFLPEGKSILGYLRDTRPRQLQDAISVTIIRENGARLENQSLDTIPQNYDQVFLNYVEKPEFKKVEKDKNLDSKEIYAISKVGKQSFLIILQEVSGASSLESLLDDPLHHHFVHKFIRRLRYSPQNLGEFYNFVIGQVYTSEYLKTKLAQTSLTKDNIAQRCFNQTHSTLTPPTPTL